jgi:hypothetical protein
VYSCAATTKRFTAPGNNVDSQLRSVTKAGQRQNLLVSPEDNSVEMALQEWCDFNAPL